MSFAWIPLKKMKILDGFNWKPPLQGDTSPVQVTDSFCSYMGTASSLCILKSCTCTKTVHLACR